MTRELGLWIFIASFALATRASGLNTLPLSDAEANEALAVLRIFGGDTAALANPFVSGLQYVLFSVFDASNLAARLPSAIGGVLLCLTPAMLRQQLGKGRALMLAGILLISPTLWFVSRDANGGAFAWALALASIFFWLNERKRLATVAFGLFLACGKDVLPALFCVVPAILAQMKWGTKSQKSPSLVNAQPSHATLWGLTLLTFIFGATALWFNPLGIGGAFNGMADWVVNLAKLSKTGGLSFSRLFNGFWLYEIFLFIVAVSALALTWLRKPWQSEIFWHVLAVMGLILCLLDNSRTPSSLIPIIIGCAGLASHVLVEQFTYFYARFTQNNWHVPITVMGLTSVLLSFGFLTLLQYAHSGQLGWLIYLLVVLLMLIGICMLFAVNGDLFTSLRGLVGAFGLCAFIYTFGNGYQLNFIRHTNPGEPYRPQVASSDLNLLSAQIDQLSTRATSDVNALPIVVDDNAPPSLRWVLRDQRSIVYGLAAGSNGIVLTPFGSQPNDQRVYVGDAYTLQNSSNLGNLNCRQIGEKLDCTPYAKWLAFRHISDVQSTQWILWVSQDTASQASGIR
jgi:hypothetical protein